MKNLVSPRDGLRYIESEIPHLHCAPAQNNNICLTLYLSCFSCRHSLGHPAIGHLNRFSGYLIAGSLELPRVSVPARCLLKLILIHHNRPVRRLPSHVQLLIREPHL